MNYCYFFKIYYHFVYYVCYEINNVRISFVSSTFTRRFTMFLQVLKFDVLSMTYFLYVNNFTAELRELPLHVWEVAGLIKQGNSGTSCFFAWYSVHRASFLSMTHRRWISTIVSRVISTSCMN